MDNITAFLTCLEPLLALGAKQRVELHAAHITAAEHDALRQCLEDGRISTAGPLGARFEEALKDYTGAAHVIATSSGSAALHLALLACGVNAGDEVLVPSLAYIAPANTIALIGAIPHFVECEPDSMGIDPERLVLYLAGMSMQRDGMLVNRETGRAIKAMLPIHSHGIPGRMDELAAVATRYGLVLIEDAAEAIGSRYKQRHVGTRHPAIVSFNGNKVISTGGGGAVLTSDSTLATTLRSMAYVARLPHPYEYAYSGIGHNYGMPSLNAALGLAQLGRIDMLLTAKRRLAEWYRERFRAFDGGALMQPSGDAHGNHWQNVLILDDPARRNAMIEAAQARGVICRAGWAPLHLQPFYRHTPRDTLTLTESLAARMIVLPSAPVLAEQLNLMP